VQLCILCALLLETGRDGAPAYRHELGDAELYNVHCAESAASKQFTKEEVHSHEDELTDNCPGQLSHDATVLDNDVKQENSPTFDLCDADVHRPPLASSSDSDFEGQLGSNIVAKFAGNESFSETNQNQAAYGSILTQEVNEAVKQCTSISDDMAQNTSATEYSDHSIVSVGLSDIRSVDHDGALNTDRDDLASRCSKSDNESMIVNHSQYSDVSECESCHKYARSYSVHDCCTADTDTGVSEVPNADIKCHISSSLPTCNTEQTGSYTTSDPEVGDMASCLDCENSKFADIALDSRSRHAKLVLDHSKLEAACGKTDEEQMTQEQLSSLFSCILDRTEDLSHGFPPAVDFQQSSNCLNAGIYASLGGMELRDDMELTPVQGWKNVRDDNTDGSEAICDLENNLDTTENVTSLSIDHIAATACASLGGMELCDDMELISIEDETTERMHNPDGTEAMCDVKDYSDSTVTVTNLTCDTDRTYSDDNLQHEISPVDTDIPEVYNSSSPSHIEERAETMSADDSGVQVLQYSDEVEVLVRDDNHGILSQPTDSSAGLLLIPEQSLVSDDSLQCTNVGHERGAQETQQILTDEVCSSDNEYSDSIVAVGEIGSTSSMVRASATVSVKSVVETENVDMLISFETTDFTSTVTTKVMDMGVFSNVSEVENSYFSERKNLEIDENGEKVNSIILAQPLDSDIRLLEHLPVSDEILQCTDTAHGNDGQKMPHSHLQLRLTDEVYDSSNEPTFVESENVDMLISSETTDFAGTVLTKVMDTAVFNSASQMEDSDFSNDNNFEVIVDGEHENTEVLAHPSDSDIRLLEHLPVSDEILQCTDTAHGSDGQKMPHSRLLPRTTDEVYEAREPTFMENENLDMLISFETTDFASTVSTKVMDTTVCSNVSEVENSYLSESKNLEVVENRNTEVLAQPSDSDSSLLQHVLVSDQMLQCTDTAHYSGGQELQPQCHRLLRPTDEVCDSGNKFTAVEDEFCRTLSAVLVLPTASISAATETKNVDVQISLETIDKDSACTIIAEVEDSLLSNSKNLEVIKNRDSENTTKVCSNGSEVENSYLSESKNLEVVENRKNENTEVLAQPSDSDSSLLQHVLVSDQLLQCTDTAHGSGGQEMPQCHLLLRPTDEVCDSGNKFTVVEDEACRTPSAVPTASISAAETKNVDAQISLETIDKDSACTIMAEVEDSLLSNSKNLEVIKNRDSENTTNTGHANTACAAYTTCTDLEFHTGAVSSETSITNHHQDLQILKDKGTPSLVYYANEDFQFSVYGSGHQVEPFTVDNVSLHTQRLELDDLTLTVTCYIPDETEELLPDSDDVLEHFDESKNINVAPPNPPYTTTFTGSDPVTSFDISHYMDHSISTIEKSLSKHRSSEFTLSHLMPIDESAEFTHDSSTDSDDVVQDRLHLLQLANELNDLKTEPGDNNEQKMHISGNVAATVSVKNPGLDGSASNARGVGMTLADDGWKQNSHEQITYKENLKTAESSVSNLVGEHSPGSDAFKHNKLEVMNGTKKYVDSEGKNTMSNNITNLDMKTSPGDETLLNDYSVITAMPVLNYQNESSKQNAESAVELCERPVFRSSNMQSVLDAIMQALVDSYETATSTPHSIVEDQSLSHMATDDRDASHDKLSSVLSSSSLAFEPAKEVDEPAIDAATDFESILEQLHCTKHST